jgi:acylpyruvate hydrolase
VRLVTLRTPDGTRAGRIEDDEIVVLEQPDVESVLRLGLGWTEVVATLSGPRVPLVGADLAPVVCHPPAIVCVGQNYAGHIEETGAARPQFPTLFAKYSSALIGAHDPLVIPAASSQVDWEVELAFVIGSRGRDLDETQAAAAIAGYTVANDVSMRDWQGRTTEFLQGKTWEASTPVGPALVTPDEIDDLDHLRLTCEIDGETMQDGITADLIFKPAVIASYLSTIFTLQPGTLVLTGTPDGIGAARTPPLFLGAGQTMRTSIAGVGELVNRCVAPAPA